VFRPAGKKTPVLCQADGLTKPARTVIGTACDPTECYSNNCVIYGRLGLSTNIKESNQIQKAHVVLEALTQCDIYKKYYRKIPFSSKRSVVLI
jgi:hypothetical protein